MIDLELDPNVVKGLEEGREKLRKALRDRLQVKIKIEREIEDIRNQLRSIHSLINIPRFIDHGQSKAPSTDEISNLKLGINVAKAPFKEALLEVLKAYRKPMTATEILNVLRGSGRKISSPHARDIVGHYLRDMSDLVEIQKNGQANLYSLKRDSHLFQNEKP